MNEPKRYESAKYVVRIIGFAIDVVLLYLLASRFSIPIRQLAEAFSNSKCASVAIYTLVLMDILKLFAFFLCFFFLFFIPVTCSNIALGSRDNHSRVG